MLTASYVIRQLLLLAIITGLGIIGGPILFRPILPYTSTNPIFWMIFLFLVAAPQFLPMSALKIHDDIYGLKQFEEFSTSMYSTPVLKKLKWPFLAGLLLFFIAIFVLPYLHSDIVLIIAALILVLMLTQSINYLAYARVYDMKDDPSDPAHDQPGRATAWWITLKLLPTYALLNCASLAFFGAIFAPIVTGQWLYLPLGVGVAGLLFFVAYGAAQRFVERLTAHVPCDPTPIG